MGVEGCEGWKCPRSIEIGGFRIFKVNDGSPAAEAGLEVFFDFIVEINGVVMDADQTTFAKAIQDAENQRTKLVVQNIRTHTPETYFKNTFKFKS